MPKLKKQYYNRKNARCSIIHVESSCLSSIYDLIFCLLTVPGDAGSRLQARLHKKVSPHFFCEKSADWFQVWLSVEELLPEVVDCWSDNMRY